MNIQISNKRKVQNLIDMDIVGVIIQAVCEKNKLSEQDLKSLVRYREIVAARQQAVYLIRGYTKMKHEDISAMFYKSDHSFSISSISVCVNDMSIYKDLKIEIDMLKAAIEFKFCKEFGGELKFDFGRVSTQNLKKRVRV